MARFLAIDWDHHQLHVVAATVAGNAVKIQRAVAWDEARTPNLAEAEELGHKLRDRLKEAGIAPAPVLICVGRDRVILKDIRHPPVPAHEEAAIVRFQAVKELTDSPDEVVIDYTPASDPQAPGERRALVLIARRELLQAYLALCKAAGLKLAGLTPRPFGTVACLKSQLGASALTPAPEPASAAVAVLAVGQRWAEFCVVRGDYLLFSRSLAVGPGLLGEVRRNLTVYAGQAPQHPMRALYVADSGEHAALRERLQELLAYPVHPFDPFGGAERPELPGRERGAFAGAVGLLQSRLRGQELPINFVQPREPKPQVNPNRRLILLAAGLAATVVVGLIVLALMHRQSQLKELAALSAYSLRLNEDLKPLEEDEKQAKALEQWQAAEVNWLDEMYDLAQRFPDHEKMRLTEFTAIPIATPRTAKGPQYVASVTLTGVCTEDELAQRLVAAMNEDSRHYRVVSLTTDVNRGGVDARQLPRRFTEKVDIQKRSPTEYKRELASAPRPGGGGGRPPGGGRPGGRE